MRIIFLLFGISLFGCNQEAVETVARDHAQEFPLERSAEQREKSSVEPDFEADMPEWTKGKGRYPYVCEEFAVRVDDQGRSRFQRHRKPWTERDRSKFRKLVSLVAREMGADPKLFSLWALRESTYQPGAVHVLDPDVRSAARAWERHRWSAVRESELKGVMAARAGIKDRPYWEAKGSLKRIQTFRGNPYYFDRVEYKVHLADGEVASESRSRWAYGYGPFGFNPTLYLPVWDAQAPPWVFCNEDGIVAAITAVWVARQSQRKCRALGEKGSYEDINRMFGSGHCQPRPSHDGAFRHRARAVGLDSGAKAKLGTKWPREQTDREEVVEFMRGRAVAAGLLEPAGA